MTWSRFRQDFAGFAHLCSFELTDAGRILAIMLNRQDRFISTVGLEPSILMLIACWRAACWPRSTTILLTPSKEHARELLNIARSAMSFASDEVRRRVLFLQNDEGIISTEADVVNVVHAMPGTLGLELPQSRETLTILIPDLDRIPGCHLKYLGRLKSRPGTCLVLNSAVRGRISR